MVEEGLRVLSLPHILPTAWGEAAGCQDVLVLVVLVRGVVCKLVDLLSVDAKSINAFDIRGLHPGVHTVDVKISSLSKRFQEWRFQLHRIFRVYTQLRRG